MVTDSRRLSILTIQEIDDLFGLPNDGGRSFIITSALSMKAKA